MFNHCQNTKIFNAIIGMNTVNVIDLFTRFKGFNKRRSNTAVYQKRPASLRARPTVTKPDFYIRFGTPSIFFGA